MFVTCMGYLMVDDDAEMFTSEMHGPYTRITVA